MSGLFALFANLALAASAPTDGGDVVSEPAGDASPVAPASYERVSEVLVGEKLCRVFGYSIDVEGLAKWANDQAARLADQNEDYELRDSYIRLTRAIRSEILFVRDRWRGAFVSPGSGNYYNTRRFQMRYRKKCEALANAPDAGAFFEKTRAEQDYLDMVANVRDNFMLVAVGGPARPGRRTPIDVRIPRN